MIITRECASNYLIPENEDDIRILKELYNSIDSSMKDNDSPIISVVDKDKYIIFINSD